MCICIFVHAYFQIFILLTYIHFILLSNKFSSKSWNGLLAPLPQLPHQLLNIIMFHSLICILATYIIDHIVYLKMSWKNFKSYSASYPTYMIFSPLFATWYILQWAPSLINSRFWCCAYLYLQDGTAHDPQA